MYKYDIQSAHLEPIEHDHNEVFSLSNVELSPVGHASPKHPLQVAMKQLNRVLKLGHFRVGVELREFAEVEVRVCVLKVQARSVHVGIRVSPLSDK